MVRFHNISGFSFDRWLLQNKGVVLDVAGGRYIDSVLVRTGRGVAALLETFSPGLVTPRYTLIFAASTDPAGVETVNNMWSSFAGARVVVMFNYTTKFFDNELAADNFLAARGFF